MLLFTMQTHVAIAKMKWKREKKIVSAASIRGLGAGPGTIGSNNEKKKKKFSNYTSKIG